MVRSRRRRDAAIVERVVQQILGAEMTSFLAADSYERTGGGAGIGTGTSRGR